MRRSLFFILGILTLYEISYAQWLGISGVTASLEETELGGPRIVIEYDLHEDEITPESPAYVFVRFSKDSGATWSLIPHNYLSGQGSPIVESGGHKRILWWGIEKTGFPSIDQIQFQVRGIRMVRIPAGEFTMKSTPGGGYDSKRIGNRVSSLPGFYMAKCETTVFMYADYLNEVGGDGAGWNSQMSDTLRCGIEQTGSSPAYSYKVMPGRENCPGTFVSWYDAVAFLDWCGLHLPSEAQWEKAYRGGRFLEGDSLKQQPNPLPERKFPWGNESPGEGGVFRCNGRGEEDGFAHTAPVESFPEYSSPYGICDLAGNVAEWTIDWYNTTYHVDLDGIRMVRGGSWRSFPSGLDAISGATSLPLRESGIMGFRGVFEF